MKPEDLPEDIDGNQDDNPYNSNIALYPLANRGSGLFSLGWREREYWRHWKRVKHDTGRWPLWSAVFHFIIVLGFITNTIVFVWAKDTQDWSTTRSWVLGIFFGVLWVIFFTGGRDVIRRYEAKLYTEHEEGNVGAHIREGYAQARRGELIDGTQARNDVRQMKETWRKQRALK